MVPSSDFIDTPEIFISYSWKKESNMIADEIEALLTSKGITVIRDKSSLGYKGLIKEFMDGLGNGRYIILILSEDYLKSENCMYELLQIAKDNFYDRIFPIVLPGTNIYKATDRIKLYHYWEKEIRELEETVKKGGLSHIQNILKDLDFYDEIRRNMDSITTILKNINSLSVPLLQTNDYEPLLQKLLDQIKLELHGSVVGGSVREEDYVALFIRQRLGAVTPEKIAEIIDLLEHHKDYSRYDGDYRLRQAVIDKKAADDIEGFYHLWEQFLDIDKLIGGSFYLSLNKLNRYFNLHKMPISSIYKITFDGSTSDEEKMKWLFRFFQDKGQLIFLPGRLLQSKDIPAVEEPVVFFYGKFKLSDRLADHFKEITTDYNPENPIPTGLAHFVMYHPDPMIYPILQLRGQTGDKRFTMEISRKYAPHSSGNTRFLHYFLSGKEMDLSGLGSIEKLEEKSYRIQPIILKSQSF